MWPQGTKYIADVWPENEVGSRETVVFCPAPYCGNRKVFPTGRFGYVNMLPKSWTCDRCGSVAHILPGCLP
jgi:hypothetical protein